MEKSLNNNSEFSYIILSFFGIVKITQNYLIL